MGAADGGSVIEFLGEVWRWFADGAHWRGTGGVTHRVIEHLQLSALPVLAAAVIALPPAVVLGHLRRGGFAAAAVANIGRAIPSFALLALSLPITLRLGLGLGYWPTIPALFLLAIPPIFINGFTGVRTVDSATLESARGMGMSGALVLRRIELPLAAPVVVAGVRVAAVQVVATATLAALVAGGGLGRYIVDGFALRDHVQIFAGALLVALLAIITEVLFTIVERLVAPRGVRRRRWGRDVKAETPPA